MRQILKRIYYWIPAVSKKDSFFVERRRHHKFLKFCAKYSKSPNSPLIQPVCDAQLNKTVWLFWYQGFDKAPDIVKACVKSIQHYYDGWNIVFLDKSNLYDFVSFDSNIVGKIENGSISITHLSDLVRLYLLVAYGGVWIDSTCYATSNIPKEVEECGLFFFKQAVNLDRDIVVSSWFIYSPTPNNKVLRKALSILLEYWNHNKKMLDYFLCHWAITIAFHEFENEWLLIPFYPSINAHVIQYLLLSKEYNKALFDLNSKKSFIHKLTYKCENREGTLFSYLEKEGKNG